MFNVPLQRHFVRSGLRQRTRLRVRVAALLPLPTKPRALREPIITEQKSYTKGIAEVYEWREAPTV